MTIVGKKSKRIFLLLPGQWNLSRSIHPDQAEMKGRAVIRQEDAVTLSYREEGVLQFNHQSYDVHRAYRYRLTEQGLCSFFADGISSGSLFHCLEFKGDVRELPVMAEGRH